MMFFNCETYVILYIILNGMLELAVAFLNDLPGELKESAKISVR
jgi:hypothetical protein